MAAINNVLKWIIIVILAIGLIGAIIFGGIEVINLFKNDNYVTSNTSKRCYYKDFIEIYQGLYYDPSTNNVYMWNESYGFSYSATVPSPYYTADGEIGSVDI